MKNLSRLLESARARGAVETAEVVKVREGRALIATPGGRVWARTALTLRAGDRVSFARVGSELHILGLARPPRRRTKVVRV